MQAIENHWLTRDRAWHEEMSEPEPDDEIEEEPCPNCEGTGSVAHRCSCGTLPTNPAYGYCEACHKPVVWRSCKQCGGTGTTIN